MIFIIDLPLLFKLAPIISQEGAILNAQKIIIHKIKNMNSNKTLSFQMGRNDFINASK